MIVALYATGASSLVPTVNVSRAWAEVTNATLGQIRFGRMPWHWGLGILSNGGNGIDSDYQTHVDRVMYQFRLRSLGLAEPRSRFETTSEPRMSLDPRRYFRRDPLRDLAATLDRRPVFGTLNGPLLLEAR